MKTLSVEELKKAYFRSKKLELDPNFTRLLKSELERRLMNIHEGI
jgi:hypothetical protein